MDGINTCSLFCMADTQLDAQFPPGPSAAVPQSAMGDKTGIVKLPKFPDTSVVI